MSVESYVHTALPGSPGSPLLLVFHGTGGDERQLVPLGRRLLERAAGAFDRGDAAAQPGT